MVKGAERKRGQLDSKGDSFLKNEREEIFKKNCYKLLIVQYKLFP